MFLRYFLKTDMNLQERLTALLEPLVESLGFELVLLEYNPFRGSAALQLFIDRAGIDAPGGITLADCERVSREVAGLLDVEDPIPQGYRLEVSSPGLDRPLVKPKDFERFAGSQAKVQLIAPLAGGSTRRKFEGVLRGMQGENVVLETVDAGKIELALPQIERARLVPDYEADLKKGSVSNPARAVHVLADSASPNQREKELRGS